MHHIISEMSTDFFFQVFVFTIYLQVQLLKQHLSNSNIDTIELNNFDLHYQIIYVNH